MVTWVLSLFQRIALAMIARRIAREMAVILLPQLPKEAAKLEKQSIEQLVARSVQMLADYAKQCLGEANAMLVKVQNELGDIEIEHPANRMRIENLNEVKVTTGQLRQQADLLERALHLVSEALDVPEACLLRSDAGGDTRHFLLELMAVYGENRQFIDDLLNQLNTRWKLKRMVSIDRDIIRLACTEMFFTPKVPINVALSEAVELCHRFADERAAKFVNGVLSELVNPARHFRATGELVLSSESNDNNTEDASALV